MRRGTFQWMKSVNKSLILNKIRTDAPISRAEIAKQTKLTPPTVSSNVKELIEQGLVIESELGQSKGGRKPTLLLINHKSFYVIGVDAGPQTIVCVLSDLAGNIRERVTKPLHESITNDEFLGILKDCIQTILNESSISSMEKIIGIGVAMHGVVDVEAGLSLFAPNLSLKNIPIKEVLENEFDLEVKVENDARAMALGEAWFGDHGELHHMLALNIGRGVGAGLVVNRQLFHGAQDIAGEVGHMTIELDGERCECGNRGCLQTFVSGPAIGKIATRTLATHDKREITGEDVYQMALAGNKKCIEILERTGEIIGIGLTNLIHVINPEKIIIGGGVTKSKQFILPVIQETIEKRALTPSAKQTEVVISSLGDDATVLGAVSLLLVDLFNPVTI